MVLLCLIYLYLYTYFFIYSFYLFCTYLPARIFTLCVFNTSCMLFPCFYIYIYTVYICIYVYVYIVTLKGFLHYSPMNSDSDCSVLPFMPIFCIYAHNSLSVRGCVWMGPAWVPLGVRRGNRTESRLTFAPCLLRPKLLLLQYNTRRY